MRLPVMTSAAALTATLASSLPATAEPPQVVTDIAPVHSLVAKVMVGVDAPTLLLDQSADPHSITLRPSQMRLLQNAELIVWMGPQFEPWLERALDNIQRAETMVLLDLPSTTLRALDDHEEDDHGGHEDHGERDDHGEHDEHEAHDEHGEHDEHEAHDDHAEHAEHEEHDGYEEHAEHEEHDGHEEHAGHDHSGFDPHAWLSPANAKAWLGEIAEHLAAHDPENAALYTANAEAAIVEVAQLEAEIAATLAPFEGAGIVTFHDAYGYFTDTFGLHVVGSPKESDGHAPSAADLADLKAKVVDLNVGCVFGEPDHDDGLLTAITEGTDIGMGTLDILGARLEAGPELYDALMRGLSDALADCLAED